MKVTINSFGSAMLKDLKKGDVFKYQNSYFVVTDEVNKDLTMICFAFSTSILQHFSPSLTVKLIDAEVVINE